MKNRKIIIDSACNNLHFIRHETNLELEQIIDMKKTKKYCQNMTILFKDNYNLKTIYSPNFFYSHSFLICY